LNDVEKELEEQIKKVLDAGIHPTHLDSHQYVHFVPCVLNIVIRLAKKYKIPFIRYSQQIPSFNYFTFKNYLKVLILRTLSLINWKRIKVNRFAYFDALIGVDSSGMLNFDRISKYIQKFKNSKWMVTEIICHPGEKNFIQNYNHWRYRWEEELDALTDNRIRRALQESKILLTNYSKLFTSLAEVRGRN
jgi:predicted glycoside hydrolase/deacetylase ChbG (UPF0249 family)